MENNIWVVEYSKQQNSFHICTLNESVETNKKLFDLNNNNDFQIISLANSLNEANEIVNNLRNSLNQMLI